jgi:hypothetical protein
MNAKDILKKIKETFDAVPAVAAPVAAAEPIAPAAPAAPSAPVMTKDGKSLVVDKMEVGGVVIVDGMPSPAATYELEDGSSIVVDETGVIIEVKPAVAQAAEPISMNEDFTALQNDYQQFKIQFDAYKQHVENRVHLAEQTIAKQDSTITQLLDLMTKIVDAPQGDVPPAQKKVFSFSKVDEKKKGFSKYANALAEISNEKK